MMEKLAEILMDETAVGIPALMILGICCLVYGANEIAGVCAGGIAGLLKGGLKHERTHSQKTKVLD